MHPLFRPFVAPFGRRARLVAATAGLAALLGLSALLGWALDVPAWRSVLRGSVEMKANAGIALIASAAALWLLVKPQTIAEARAAGVLLTSLVLELTESRLVADPIAPLDLLTRLRLKQISLIGKPMPAAQIGAWAGAWASRFSELTRYGTEQSAPPRRAREAPERRVGAASVDSSGVPARDWK